MLLHYNKKLNSIQISLYNFLITYFSSISNITHLEQASSSDLQSLDASSLEINTSESQNNVDLSNNTLTMSPVSQGNQEVSQIYVIFDKNILYFEIKF